MNHCLGPDVRGNPATDPRPPENDLNDHLNPGGDHPDGHEPDIKFEGLVEEYANDDDEIQHFDSELKGKATI